jgi:hypothetical protein
MSEKSKKLLELVGEGWPVRKAAAQLGISTRYAFSVVAKAQRADEPEDPGPSCGIKTVPIAELIDTERLDFRKLMRDGLARIPDGEVARDETLRKDLGISCERWREVSREEEFAACKAILPNRRVVWGRPKTIQALRKLDGVS